MTISYDDTAHYAAQRAAFDAAYALPEGQARDAAVAAVTVKYPFLKAEGPDWVALASLLARADWSSWEFQDPFLRETLRFLGSPVGFAARQAASGGDGRGGVGAVVLNLEEFLNRIKEHYHEKDDPAYKLYDDAQAALRELMWSPESPLVAHPHRVEGANLY